MADEEDKKPVKEAGENSLNIRIRDQTGEETRELGAGSVERIRSDMPPVGSSK